MSDGCPCRTKIVEDRMARPHRQLHCFRTGTPRPLHSSTLFTHTERVDKSERNQRPHLCVEGRSSFFLARRKSSPKLTRDAYPQPPTGLVRTPSPTATPAARPEPIPAPDTNPHPSPQDPRIARTVRRAETSVAGDAGAKKTARWSVAGKSTMTGGPGGGDGSDDGHPSGRAAGFCPEPADVAPPPLADGF